MTLTTTRTYFTTFTSPIGELLLQSDGEFITGLYTDQLPDETMTPEPNLFRDCVRQLRAYFAGELKLFDLPLKQPGTTFQKQVWKQLLKVPYGQTISYQTLAKRVGKPLACRAVGSANGKNQIVIVVPCHRVIAANNTLGGYGCGLWRKEWLLKLEGVEL
jgi:methylated-DNA-[protein]-cysteine S-methyltransferase